MKKPKRIQLRYDIAKKLKRMSEKSSETSLLIKEVQDNTQRMLELFHDVSKPTTT